MGVVQGARYAYFALAWAFVAGLVLQVFFIGLGLFNGAEYRETHAWFGWTILHLSPLLILVATPLAHAARARILQAVGLAVIVWIVPILAAVRADLPLAAAFHPVGALLAFWLATVMARGATSLIGSADTERSPTRTEWAIVVVVVVVLVFLSFSGSPT
jgi:nicotinamide riboside transporter PnuC